jgi:putative nucleotidyltransferase with HDIG domain
MAFAMDLNWLHISISAGAGMLLGLGLALGLGRVRRPPQESPAEVEAQLHRLRSEIEDQVRRWEALPNLLASLSSVEEPEKLYSSIAFVTREYLGAEYAAVLLRKDKDFVTQVGEGLSEETVQTFRLPVKEGLVRYILETNSPVRLEKGDRQLGLFRNLREPIREAMLAPLRTGAEVFGLLWVANKAQLGTFTKSDLDLASYLAIPFSLAVHNANVFKTSQKTVVDMLIEICRQLEDRDPLTRGHSARVAELAVRGGRQLRMSPADLETLRVAALLHDLGRMALPAELWNKPTELTDQERDLVRSHTRRAVELLKPLGYVERALPLVLYHHEHYDGSGYPVGLRGTAIPVGALVIGMAEAYDALTHDRPHRPAVSPAEAHRLLSEQAGKRFDPQILRPFLQMLDQDSAAAPVNPVGSPR